MRRASCHTVTPARDTCPPAQETAGQLRLTPHPVLLATAPTACPSVDLALHHHSSYSAEWATLGVGIHPTLSHPHHSSSFSHPHSLTSCSLIPFTPALSHILLTHSSHTHTLSHPPHSSLSHPHSFTSSSLISHNITLSSDMSTNPCTSLSLPKYARHR